MTIRSLRERCHIVPSPHCPSKTGVNALSSGEGQGGGYAANAESSNHPPPHPSPSRGEGADRACRTACDTRRAFAA
jgi:hypothetical protein